MRHWARYLAIIVAAAGIPAAAEDLTIVSKVTSDKNPPSTATSYMSSDHIRMVQGDGKEFMMDFKAGEMTTIDHQKKEYYVITKQDMLAMQAKMQEQMNSPEMKKAQQQMKSLPPEMQKKMEAMMGGAATAVDVHKTGTTRKVAGYTCENWTITMGQFSKTEQCLTTELQYPVQAWDSFREFADGMRSMAQSMGPMAKGMAQMQDKFKDMRGVPLAHTSSVNVMGHSSNTSSEVTEIRRGPIAPSAWEIPAGYTKVASPMTKALDKKQK